MTMPADDIRACLFRGAVPGRRDAADTVARGAASSGAARVLAGICLAALALSPPDARSDTHPSPVWRQGDAPHADAVAPAAPSASQAPAPEDVLSTVGELLRLEADQALALARRRTADERVPIGLRTPFQAAATPSMPAPGMRPDGAEPRLVAIYGVGRQVRLLLQLQGQSYLYRAGRPWPTEHGLQEWLPELPRLQAVDGNCARFRLQDRPLVLCLSQGQSLARIARESAIPGGRP